MMVSLKCTLGLHIFSLPLYLEPNYTPAFWQLLSGSALNYTKLQLVFLTGSRAPLSYFSDTTTGTILNRFVLLSNEPCRVLRIPSFSQDIYFVDRQLPTAFSGIGIRKNEKNPIITHTKIDAEVFKLLVQVALLFSVQHLLALTLPFCMSIVYAVQKIYLRTSRQLRLLEIESRSAIYSSFLETVCKGDW